MRVILGPGPQYLREEGTILVDKIAEWATDGYVCDFMEGPLPFKDGTVDYVEAFNILEHVEGLKNYRRLMEEVNRILKVGGKFDIKVPHKDHPSAYATHDHVRFFIDFSFNDFTVNNPWLEEQGIKTRFDYDLRTTYADKVSGVPEQIHVILKKVI